MWGILAGAVLAALAKWLPSLLAAVGIYFVADTVSSQIFSTISARIDQSTASLSSVALNALQFSGLLEGITIIITAYTTALTMRAAKAGLSGVGGA